MSTSNTQKQYLIGTCLGCKKCLYCGAELSIRKKACSCDKTIKPCKSNRTNKVKIAYPRVSSPDLPPEPLKFIQESITRFGYSLDFKTKFSFTFCCACNSSFQRKKRSKSNSSVLNLPSLETNENSLKDDNNVNFDEINKINEEEYIISFNLIIKPSTGPALPSKWVEINVSSLDDILAEVHYYIGKLIGNKDVVHSDYLVTFKPEKAAGIGAGLVDTQDYKKFLLDYRKLLEAKKNMTIIVSMKKKGKEKQKVKSIQFIKKNKILLIFLFILLYRKTQILKNQKMKIKNYVKKIKSRNWTDFLKYYNKKDALFVI